MHTIVFFGNVDLTEVILLTFTLFFIGLVLYLRREDRREGYPLESESGRLEPKQGLLFYAQPKTFHLPHGGGVLTKPNDVRESQTVAAKPTSRAPGSPLVPTGDPMLAGVGPGAFAQRARVPDVMHDGTPKLRPLRVAPQFSLDPADPDPRGMSVLGADRQVAGVVADVWVDRAEYMIRYLEVALAPSPEAPVRRVLLPMTMSVIDKGRKVVRVDAILASQFSGVPGLAQSDQVTLDEEERVCAYYGGGYLYATAQRAEPVI
jgi:photosynthetic reaction center H subunit